MRVDCGIRRGDGMRGRFGAADLGFVQRGPKLPKGMAIKIISENTRQKNGIMSLCQQRMRDF
jgi:hypothetical protein